MCIKVICDEQNIPTHYVFYHQSVNSVGMYKLSECTRSPLIPLPTMETEETVAAVNIRDGMGD